MKPTVDTGPRCRDAPSDCRPGDWIPAGNAADWPPDEPTFAYVLPGQVMVDPLHQLPVPVPLVSWTFRRGVMPDAGGQVVPAWVRES